MKKIILFLYLFMSTIFSQSAFIDSAFTHYSFLYNLKILDGGTLQIDTSKIGNVGLLKPAKIVYTGSLPSNTSRSIAGKVVDGGTGLDSTVEIPSLNTNNDGSYIIIDIIDTTWISKIIIPGEGYPPSYFPKKFEIFSSNDSLTWNLEYSDSNHSPSNNLMEFDSLFVRFIKFVFYENPNSEQPLVISEIEIIGVNKSIEGRYFSKIVELDREVEFGEILATGDNLEGNLFYKFRGGDNERLNSTWSEWSDYIPYNSSQIPSASNFAYFQYELKLIKGAAEPKLNSLRFNFSLSTQHWKKYSRKNSFLPYDKIYRLIVDSQNNLWIHGQEPDNNFPNSYDHFSKFAFDTSLFLQPAQSNSAFAAGRNEIFYCESIGYKYNKLYKFAGSGWNEIQLPPLFYNATAIAIDQNNFLWIAGNSLARYDGANWKVYDPYTSQLPSSKLNYLAIDKNNIIWLSTEDIGVVRFDPLNDTWNIFNKYNTPIIQVDNLGKIFIDGYNKVYVEYNSIYYNTFAYKFDGHIWSDIRSLSIFSQNIQSDSKNNIWYKEGGNLVKYDTSAVIYNSTNSFLSSSVTAFTIDQYDNIWVSDFVYLNNNNHPNLYLFNENGIVTSVDERPSITEMLPNSFQLFQNYPNPFNPTTNIRFRIAELGFVSLKVYGILGNEVADLVNEEKIPGEYEVSFNGSSLSSGVYFCTLSHNSKILTNKMLLLK